MEAESTTEEQEVGDSRSCVRDSIVEEASDLIMVEDIVSLPFMMQTTYDFFNDIIHENLEAGEYNFDLSSDLDSTKIE